jgi:hypothetical protein
MNFFRENPLVHKTLLILILSAEGFTIYDFKRVYKQNKESECIGKI